MHSKYLTTIINSKIHVGYNGRSICGCTPSQRQSFIIIRVWCRRWHQRP